MKFIAERYKIQQEISKGIMSKIYRAYDTEKEEIVAIKVLFGDSKNDDIEKIKEIIFNREVEILKRINNPYIEKILDYGKDESGEEKFYYIVLEYIDGGNLKEVINCRDELTVTEKLKYIIGILNGVECLHNNGIIHRDLKPSNIMLTKDKDVKIIDFGISKLENTFYCDATVAGHLTPMYCAPEQKLGRDITFKSDIYSLGLIFYELFTDEGDIKDRKFVFENIPKAIKTIIEKMLKEDENQRYPSVRSIKRDVGVVYNGENKKDIAYLYVTNSLIASLLKRNYICDRKEARSFLKKELNTDVYLFSHNEDELFIETDNLKILIDEDKNRANCLVAISVYETTVDKLLQDKENAYLIPYTVETVFSKKDCVKGVSIRDLLMKYYDFEADERERIARVRENNNLLDKWKKILELQRNKINREKSTLQYKSFDFYEGDTSAIILKLRKMEHEIEVDYAPDDVLKMTLKDRINRSVKVGKYRKETDEGIIIDLDTYFNVDNLAKSGEVSLDLDSVEISLKRQEDAMRKIRFRETTNPDISDIVFCPRKANQEITSFLDKKDCFSSLIDDSKLENLNKALSNSPLFVLQGPPGTGKTTFITELVSQIRNDNSECKILIASQSHVAVDNSLERIKKAMPDVSMIRIGRKEKFAEEISDYTLDAYYNDWVNSIVDNCQNALNELRAAYGLDEDLQKKQEIVLTMEKLRIDMIEGRKRTEKYKTEEKRLVAIIGNIKDVDGKLNELKNIVQNKFDEKNDENILTIIADFATQLDVLNNMFLESIDTKLEYTKKHKEVISKRKSLEEISEQKEQEYDNLAEMMNINSYEELKIVKDDIAKKLKNNKEKYSKYIKIKETSTEWMKKIRQSEELLQESLNDADVIGATCLGIASLKRSVDINFDWVIVDEAGKSTPSELLVPMCMGKKCVLIGDHRQLPPIADETLISDEIKRVDLEVSFLEYLYNNLPDSCKGTLETQYRMNPIIGNLVSEAFYDGMLKSSTKIKFPQSIISRYEHKPLVWLSTAKKNNHTEVNIGNTYYNPLEIDIIFKELTIIDEELSNANVKKTVGIIAGYKAQVQEIKKIYRAREKFENIILDINSVDAFQGREMDYIIYSVVRSNSYGGIGFLKDERRLNVAFSRAREMLVVIGDHETVLRRINDNPFVKVIDYITTNEDDCMFMEL